MLKECQLPNCQLPILNSNRRLFAENGPLESWELEVGS